MGVKKIRGVGDSKETALDTPALVERSKAWMNAHSTQLLLGALAVVAGLAILWGIGAYQRAQEKRANAAYGQVLKSWPDENSVEGKDWEKVIAELERFIPAHGGTRAASHAQLDLARAYMQVKRYEDALKWNQKALDDISEEQGLSVLARYQLAQAYQAVGNTEEALAQWKAVRGKGSSALDREVEWYVAKLYAKKHDYPMAVSHYEQALKTPGTYPNTALLQEELSSVKLKTGAQ